MSVRNRQQFWKLEAFPVLLLQIAVCVASGLAGWLLWDSSAGYSAALGGCIAWLPNAWFIYKAFRYYGARSMQAIVQSFWSGLAGKMVFTAVLFALAFAIVEPLSVVALFCGFVLVQMAGMASLLLIKSF